MKFLTTLAVGLVAGTAFAQTTFVDIDDDAIVVQPLNLTVDQVEDMDVLDAAGVKIGEVEDVLGTTATQPTAVTIDADDYFGQRGHDVVLGIDQIQLRDGKLVTATTREALMAMPRRAD